MRFEPKGYVGSLEPVEPTSESPEPLYMDEDYECPWVLDAFLSDPVSCRLQYERKSPETRG